MDRDTLRFGGTVVLVAVGLAMVVLAEATGGSIVLLSAGGVIGLAGVAAMTYSVAAIPEPDGEREHGH
jgi:hypothetical protein